MSSKATLILLVGPTGVGKSDIAIQLAERIGSEIVSADSRLFYRGMDIGTAKPTLADRMRAPHHLIDIAEPDEILSLAVFQQRAHEAILNIQARHRLPLVVGGTGQYVRAIAQGWMPPEVKPDPRLRQELENIARTKVNSMNEKSAEDWLHDKLGSLDPVAADKIDARNFRRTIRALEVILMTGRKFSEQRGQANSPYHVITIGLTRPRPELYTRIDERIDSMFQAGFLDEVRGLLAKGYTAGLPSMSAIGYREGIEVVEGKIDLEAAKVKMRRATRIFVRRQANWFKSDDPEIKWFVADENTPSNIQSFLETLP
jgi:tRNA dimethylallyltransferase